MAALVVILLLALWPRVTDCDAGGLHCRTHLEWPAVTHD